MARTVRDKYAVVWKWKQTLTADSWWMFPGRACQLVLDARVEPGATLVARSWPELNSTQLSSNTISIVHGLPPNLPEQIFWLSTKTCTPMHTSLSGPRDWSRGSAASTTGTYLKMKKVRLFATFFRCLSPKRRDLFRYTKGTNLKPWCCLLQIKSCHRKRKGGQ